MTGLHRMLLLVPCAALLHSHALLAQTVVWPPDFEAQLTAELNRTMGPWLDASGYGYWFGFQNATTSFGIALGSSNGLLGPGRVAAAPSDIVPAGSLTKAFTASMVMKLVENGTIGFNDPISMHVDPWLTRVNGTTLAGVFGPPINNVTVRMLLNMRSGIPDYDDDLIFNLTLAYPDWDISPLDYLALNPTTFVCPPGTCSGYSSTGFMLLAMACANHANATGWEGLDQLSFLPPALRESYSELMFFKHGPCADYPGVVHYFIGSNVTSKDHDMYNTSCLNGWGFGNIGISARNAASFFFDLLGPKSQVLSRRSVFEMQQFRGIDDPHDSVVGNGHHYGPLLLLHCRLLLQRGCCSLLCLKKFAFLDTKDSACGQMALSLFLEFWILMQSQLPGHLFAMLAMTATTTGRSPRTVTTKDLALALVSWSTGTFLQTQRHT